MIDDEIVGDSSLRSANKERRRRPDSISIGVLRNCKRCPRSYKLVSHLTPTFILVPLLQWHLFCFKNEPNNKIFLHRTNHILTFDPYI